MRYIEHEFIGYYVVEESDELYSIEDSKIIKGIGNFLMGFGAFGAVFFMNTQKANEALVLAEWISNKYFKENFRRIR
jgi:hypothetical protein